jgi:hypothetical protein
MSFSAEAFKQSVVNDVTADSYTPIPEGEYKGTITKTDVAGGESSKGNTWARYDIWIETADPDKAGEMRTVRAGIMLDLTESGGVAAGANKNIQLGQLRTAIGKNKPGQPWSWDDAVGCQVAFLVKHRLDKEDATKKYENVVAFKAPY